MNFFDMCEIETSLFDRDYAEKNANWLLIKKIYEKNINQTTHDNPIPKIIHFIWLGAPMPEWYAKNIEDWKNKNPDFEVKIWGNEEVEEFLPEMKTKTLYLASPSWGNKSDILRYEILKKYGGLYVDVDFLCLSSEFTSIHDKCSFYAGICLERSVQMNNGIMASSVGHPVLDLCIDRCTLDNPWNIACDQTKVLYQTGPWVLTESIINYIRSWSWTALDNILIFPSQSFHPFPARYRDEATEELIKSYLKPWSHACHLWHASWQPTSKHYVGDLI